MLDEGHDVTGYDGFTDYYDVALKRQRDVMLQRYPRYVSHHAMLEDVASLSERMKRFEPDIVVHLAAQAGVRHSIDNPRAHLDANIVGTFNVMEAARIAGAAHLLMASTSSVYGANRVMPYTEGHMTDLPMSFYAATKKAGEAMGHAWAHIHGLPVTMFRLFTVYGPWGRPDMALFKFTKGVLEGQPVEVYDNGQMWRDFTYVGDLVRAIRLLMDVIPRDATSAVEGDSLSPVAPFRIVNIGNSERVQLEELIFAIERATGRDAIRVYSALQKGDMPATWADAGLLQRLTGYAPQMPLQDGVQHFVDWYRMHYSA